MGQVRRDLLAIGLDEEDAAALLPDRVRMRNAEHIAAFFEPFGAGSPFAGVGPADVHTRDPRTLPLVVGGAEVIGDGILAGRKSGHVVICQLVPWQFDYGAKLNVKRTYRRTAFLVSRLLANMGARRDAAPGPVRRARDRPGGAALARRPLPRPARGGGRPVPLLPLVRGDRHLPAAQVPYDASDAILRWASVARPAGSGASRASRRGSRNRR